MRVRRRRTENLALRKKVATSVLAAEAMTFLIILAMTAMELLRKQTVGVTEEDEAPRAASCFAGDKVGSVAVNRKDHVAGSVHFAGIWVAGTVVEDVDDSLGCFLGAIGFGSGEFLEGVHHGVAQGLRNVEELAGDLFKAFGLLRRERQRGVNSSELLLGVVLRWVELGRGVEVLGWELMLDLE